MVEKIENEKLSVSISTLGAELKSIYRKDNDREYIWSASPEWWPRNAPVLFPIVGKLNQNVFRAEGKTFSLPQHGFARDQEFQIVSKTRHEIAFILRSNESLQEKFPYPFELVIAYSLSGSAVCVTYTVRNTGGHTMYFSIGAHPGFALHPGDDLADYYLEFEQEETLDRYLLQDGLFNGKTERVLTDSKILPLHSDLFKKDAIVFKNMKSSCLLLKSNRSDYRVQFDFPEFPYFGIWSKPGASFLCLEPWCGLADHIGFEGEFRDKEGVRQLRVDETFARGFTVTLD